MRFHSGGGREGESSWIEGTIGENQQGDTWLAGGGVLNDTGCARKECQFGQRIGIGKVLPVKGHRKGNAVMIGW